MEQEKEEIQPTASGAKEDTASTKVESVKAPIILLELEPASLSEPSVRCGDWLHRVGLVLDTVTETSSAWWVGVATRTSYI